MRKLLSTVAFGAVLAAGGAHAAGYILDITTSYQFGAPAGASGYSGGPDTSFITYTNAGTSTFVGTLGDIAVAGNGGGTDYSQSFSLTLAPGASFTFGTSPESSNVGGFNGPGGIEVYANGTFGTKAVSLSVTDSNIHSGVVNGGGLTDAFVLQGGNPSGGDYGDGIETTQANGQFSFYSAAPEPTTWAIMLLGVGMVGATMRRRRAFAA